MDHNGVITILVVSGDWGTDDFPAEPFLDYFRARCPDYRFVPVLSREEALSAVRGQVPPDLILLDLRGEAGSPEEFDILAAMRDDGLDIPVIAITRSTSPADIRRALATYDGFDVLDVIFKEGPVDAGEHEDLAARLKVALRDRGRFVNDTGALITHGTDTMAWGHAILRHALKGLNANVAITGSQLPLEGFYSPSDAIGNLKTALYLLARLRPPNIFVVFNDGRAAFSSGLQKVRKWDFDAFTGALIGEMRWEEMIAPGHCEPSGYQPRPRHCFTVHPRPRLKQLFLFRTGGTIESEKDPATGALKPTGDFVGGYILTSLKRDFVDEVLIPECSLQKDSSDLTAAEWLRTARWVGEALHCEVDTDFEWNVRCVLANPLATTDDYLRSFAAAGKGVVLLGYGAGNANTDLSCGASVLPALDDAKKREQVVVVSSQVPLETYDFEYDTGRKLLEHGAIPSGSLSFPEAQVRLAYILGHEDEIAVTLAAHPTLSYVQLVKSAFLAGVAFRTERSRQKYEVLTQNPAYGPPVKVMNYDPFTDNTLRFKQAITRVAAFLVSRQV